MSRVKRISIVIVNWNSCAYLKECLRSIYSNVNGLDIEVVVVDNASFDGSEGMVAAEFPHVQFIQSEDNLGFGGANNLGFERSHGDSVLFLNPDTEVVGDALARMESVLQSTRDAGIVGVRLLNSDLTLQTSCVTAFPSIWNQTLDAELLRQRFPKAALWGTRVLFEGGSAPAQVEAISGACMMIKRATFEQVRGFTKDYFMYAEDMDLCFKVVKAGWKNYYLGDATVIHHGGRSSEKKSESNFAAIMTKESLRTFYRIRRGPVYALLFQMAMGLASVCRVAALAGVYVLTLGRFRGESLHAALRKWLGVLGWSVGLAGWVKKSA